jgi:F-type H+-transporting ATPase subunit a
MQNENPDDIQTEAQANAQSDIQSDIPAPVSQPEGNFFQRTYARGEAYAKADPQRFRIIIGALVLLLLDIIIKFAVAVPQPHVSLAAQPLLEEGPAWFTNSFLTTIIVDIVILLLAWSATRNLTLIPSGLQNLFETALEFIYNLAESVAGRGAATYFPWVATIFIFVLISNYSGLIPLVGSWGFKYMVENKEEFVPLFRAPSADLSTTFALALATMFMVQYHGFKALGGKYFRKFAFWSPSGEGFMKGINGFVGFLELISEISRILTFSFRLFGNIFAGEVVLAVISFLVPFLIPVVFYGLEVMVGAIQAFVFMMLALVFFNMATISHDHSEEHH